MKLLKYDLCHKCRAIRPIMSDGKPSTISNEELLEGKGNNSGTGYLLVNRTLLFHLKENGGCEKCISLVERAINHVGTLFPEDFLAEIRERAEQGDAEAMFNLSMKLSYQQGAIDPDRKFPEPEEINYWIEKAAHLGLPEAEYDWGCVNANELDNYEEAVKWYKKAALNGHTSAKHNLATCYIMGTGVEVDPAESFYWMEQAANEGNPRATRKLGLFYLDGVGTPVNRIKGMALLKKALELGDEMAEEDIKSYTANVTIPSDYKPQYNTLHIAAREGSLSDVVYYTEVKRVDLNRPDEKGTPLQYAVYNCNIDVVDYLLSKGADVNARENSGAGVLHYPNQETDFEVERLLISYGADLNAKNNFGATPLHRACSRKDVDFIQFLLSNGASIDERDVFGNTALQGAARWGNIDIVKLLVSEGASLSTKDENQKGPVEHAREEGHSEVVQFLKNCEHKNNNLSISNISPFTKKHIAGNESQDIAISGSLKDKLSWLKNNAESDTEYTIALSESEALREQTLEFAGKTNIVIHLKGHLQHDRCVITISGNGSAFIVKSGVTLSLEDGVTVQGHKDNTSPAVQISAGGTLLMHSNSKIEENSNIDSDLAEKGGGVYVDKNGRFEMFGGLINDNQSLWGGGVNIDENGEFILHGGEVGYNKAYYGGGVFVQTGGTFRMIKGEINKNVSPTDDGSGGGVYVSKNGTFIFDGGNIFENIASVGGGVKTDEDSRFIMNYGFVFENKATDDYGAGIVVRGYFQMKGGKIHDNKFEKTDESSGGGIYLGSDAECEIISGEIYNHTADYGGGVSVYTNNCKISGGDIYGNVALKSGGGVYVQSEATLKLTGGSITNNTANHGGGIAVLGDMQDKSEKAGTLLMSGGSIKGNKANYSGGGIYSSGFFSKTGGFIPGSGKSANTVEKWGAVVYLRVAEGKYKIRENTADKNTDLYYNKTGSAGGWDEDSTENTSNNSSTSSSSSSSSGGCYIATAVYGDYDAPEVITLRHFRDDTLASSALGRLFIKLYYKFSPSIAEWLKDKRQINRTVRRALDKMVSRLNNK